jgi:hypothetical protein
MNQNKPRCKICGGTPGRGMKNCPGCSQQTVAEDTAVNENSFDLHDEFESQADELNESVAKVEELSSFTFGLSIIIGIAGAILGIIAFITLTPTDNEEGNGSIGLIAGV